MTRACQQSIEYVQRLDYPIEMRITTRTQIQTIEAKAAKSGLSEETLMESAGYQAANWIRQNFPELRSLNVAVIAGMGHNGADGLVVARELSLATKVTVFCSESSRPLWQKNFKKLRGLNMTIRSPQEFRAGDFDILVDALYGIGLNRELAVDDRALVNAMNTRTEGRSSKNLKSILPAIISLDVPSGLDCDRGLILGTCVCADHTLTFNRSKPGFFVNDGPSCAGRVHILDIGLREFDSLANTHFSVTRRWVARNKPQFGEQIHKSDRGRTLLIAGSAKYPGAGILSARAALRCGSGYVQLASDGASNASWENPDFLVSDISDLFLRTDSNKKSTSPKFDAVAIGPGLGVNSKAHNLIVQLKDSNFENVVLDADAITVCVNEKLFPLPASWVATPHAGELGRVLKVDAATIESDRFRYAEEGRRTMGCQVLLKGFHSVLATHSKETGNVIVIPTGNSALAKSGTGDVLTGMIASLMAQGMSSTRAALFGSYLHGWIADRWVAMGRDPAGMMASDLIANLPRALQYFQKLRSSK